MSFSHLRYWKFDADAGDFLTPPVLAHCYQFFCPIKFLLSRTKLFFLRTEDRRQNAGTGGGNEYVVQSGPTPATQLLIAPRHRGW